MRVCYSCNNEVTVLASHSDDVDLKEAWKRLFYSSHHSEGQLNMFLYGMD